MGKKGKGNKLAKMSEEERVRYLQMRADIEEEARRRKMQLISLYMKNKLKREEAFCRLNMAKINQEWRSILRHMKCQELRNEMMEVEKCFKEALERKERIMQRLLNDLDVAEDMYATLEQSHMEIIQRLIGTHRQRVEYLQRAYENEKDLIQKDYMEDFSGFQKMRKQAQEELECVIYQLEDKNDTKAKMEHEKHLEKLDDVKSKIQFRLERITKSGEEKLERLWKEYQDVLSTYVKHTEVFYTEYMDLKEREEENTQTIRDHYREIEYLSEQLANYKLLSLNVSEKCETKINYLMKIKNDLYLKLTIKKESVDSEIKTEAQRFKLMSVESHYGLENLKEIVKKGEILLQLSIVCRKYETEREQLMKFSLPAMPRQMFHQSEENLSLIPLKLKDDTLDLWKYMEKFWKSVNNASIDVVALRKQKKKLEKENENLKALLQEYLVNLNLSNGSNLHINDYLAKRPSSMRVDRVIQMTPETTLFIPKKSFSAKSDRRRQRLMGQAGVIPSSMEKDGTSSFYRRRFFANITEANLTNAVRSKNLIRGKPQLAKIESFVNWPELRRSSRLTA